MQSKCESLLDLSVQVPYHSSSIMYFNFGLFKEEIMADILDLKVWNGTVRVCGRLEINLLAKMCVNRYA